MLRSVFLKTLFEKRWMTFWWFVASTALVVFIVAFFPTLRDSFGEALKDVPESMRSLIGNAADYQTLSGYLNLQVFQQMVMMPIILGVILCTGLIGGDENEGTLQTLLTHPVSRTKVYVHKLLASTIIIGVVTSSLFFGSWLGAVAIGEQVNLWDLFTATVMAWLVGLVISMIGYSLSAATGKRALAGSLAGAYAFIMYTVTSLVTSVEALKAVDYFSPFHYYNQPSPLTGSFDLSDMWILLVASVFLAVLGYTRFIRRDIYQR